MKNDQNIDEQYQLESPIKERAYFEIMRYDRQEAKFLRGVWAS